MNRQTYLLLVATFLLVIQFLVIPVFSVLDEERAAFFREENKHNKAQALISLKTPLIEQLNELEQFLAKSDSYVYNTESLQAGTLEVQKIIEDKAAKHGVSIKRLNWQDDEGAMVQGSVIQLIVDGAPENWIMLQSELDSLAWLSLSRMTFYYARQSNDDSLIGNLSGLLSYKVNFEVDSDG